MEVITGELTLSTFACTYAKTGVLCSNICTNLLDHITYHAVNVDLQSRITEYKREHGIPEGYNLHEDPDELLSYYEKDQLYEDYDCDTLLIGYKQDENGQWCEDLDAEYCAKVTELWTFVTRSKYVTYCSPGSPCIPHQCDLESPGSEIAFTLPPDVWMDDKPEWMQLMEVGPEVKNLSEILLANSDSAKIF